MKKIILYLTLGIFLISIVEALEHGEILDQKQVDALDFKTEPLSCGWVKTKENKPVVNFRRYVDEEEPDIRILFRHHCLNLERIKGDPVLYNTTWKNFYPQFLYHREYGNCQLKNVCKARIKISLTRQLINYVIDHRLRLMKLQTPESNPEELWEEFLP